MKKTNSKYQILIVEDNDEQANLIKLLTEQYGFVSRYITDSTLAYEKIKSDKPQVVILDLMMPEVDGLRLCRQIKETPETSNTKVIFYSGKMYETDRRKALELGADAFLIKPTRANVLISKIKDLIQPTTHATYQA